MAEPLTTNQNGHKGSSLFRVKSRGVAEVEGNTVGECLGDLVRHFPKRESELFDNAGKLSGKVFASINSKSGYPEELKKPVGVCRIVCYTGAYTHQDKNVGAHKR